MLDTKYQIRKIYIQDPVFHRSEIEFFQTWLGYEVIQDPMAHVLISSSTFLYTPALPPGLALSYLCIASPSLIISKQDFNVEYMWVNATKFLLRNVPVIRDFWRTRSRARIDGRWAHLRPNQMGQVTGNECGVHDWALGNALFWLAGEHSGADERIQTYYNTSDDPKDAPPHMRAMAVQSQRSIPPAVNEGGILFYPNGRFSLLDELETLLEAHPNADGEMDRKVKAVLRLESRTHYAERCELISHSLKTREQYREDNLQKRFWVMSRRN